MITAQQAREQTKPPVKTEEEIEFSITVSTKNGYSFTYIELTDDQVKMLTDIGYTAECVAESDSLNKYRISW